jgi:hypothetical protein
MIRQLLSLGLVGVVAAVVGAQAPRSLRSDERGVIYRMNRPVIEKLVDESVSSAGARGNHLKRADSYYPVLREFIAQIKAAQTDRNIERADDLTRQLTALVDKGLAPTLTKAKLQVEGGSGQDEFPKVRDDLVAQLNGLLEILNDPAARTSLEGARSKVYSITLPPKK